MDEINGNTPKNAPAAAPGKNGINREKKDRMFYVPFIVCFVICCALGIAAAFGVRLYYPLSYASCMLLLALVMFVLALHRRKQRAIQMALAILTLIVVIFVWAANLFVSYRFARDPVSGRRFAAEMMGGISFSLNNRSRIRYYEDNGFFLYNPMTTDYEQVSWDNAYFAVDADGIYINFTFMSGGVTYPAKGYAIRLQDAEIKSIALRREKHDRVDVFRIEAASVTYYRSDTKIEQQVAISPSQRQEIIALLETAQLTASRALGEYGYELAVDGKNSEHTTVYVDGEEIFAAIAALVGIELPQP